jgi:hypothetical protein
MRGFLKTLIGDPRNVGAAGICLVIAVIILHTPAAPLTGLALPLMLLCAAAFLSRY